MEPVHVLRQEDGLAEIVLDRPAKKNALRNADWTRLKEAAEALDADGAVRCVLVRGEGGDFCAGWDLTGADTAGVDAEATIAGIVNPALLALRDLRVPSLAAVEGVCLGGGLGIAMACDMVLAAEDARLGSPFRDLGLMPDSGAHHFLRERLGHQRAAQLIYTGRKIDGRKAAAWGLAGESHPADALLEAARETARHVAAGPTAAFVESKRLLRDAPGYAETLAREAQAQARVFATADAAEGLAAFAEKRKPVFKGR